MIYVLTHLLLVPHMYTVNRHSIGSDNGLSHLRCQAITWTNTGLLSIGLLGIHFNENGIGILSFSFKKNAFEIVVCKNGGHCPGGDGLMKVRTRLSFMIIPMTVEILATLGARASAAMALTPFSRNIPVSANSFGINGCSWYGIRPYLMRNKTTIRR